MGLDWIAEDNRILELEALRDSAEENLLICDPSSIDIAIRTREAADDALEGYRHQFVETARAAKLQYTGPRPVFVTELLERTSYLQHEDKSFLDLLGWDNSFRAKLLLHHVVCKRKIDRVGIFFERKLDPAQAAQKAAQLAALACSLEAEWRVLFRARAKRTVDTLCTASLWLWFWSERGCHILCSW